MVLVARELAVSRPAEIGLRDDHVSLGWGAINEQLNRVANGVDSLTLRPNRRVAVFAENGHETVLAHLGAAFASCSTVPVNFHLGVDEVEYILRDSKADVVFVSPETAERGLTAASAVGITTVIGWRCESTPGLTPWDDFLAAASSDEPDVARPPQPNLMYTSGTTGRPKGVDLPPTMFAGGASMGEWIERLRVNRFANFGIHVTVGPLYHTGPLQSVRLLAVGVPVHVLGRFDAEAVLRAIDRSRAETTVMVPTHFVRLLALPDDVKQRYDISSMKLVAHTGAACPVDVKRRMIEWFGPVFMDAYGSTEVGTICTIASNEWLEHPGSVGRCNPPFERAFAVDEDDKELPAGEEGRLYFVDSTGRGIVYPDDPAKTAAAHIAPGVFTIGEIGYVTPDGFVYLTDRSSDMIVSGGVNIYPAEAEQVLIEHPGVLDVAVIGVPDAEMGEAVKALVVPRDEAMPPRADELIALCRERLAGYKCPRTVDIVDTIGRTTMGKINKRTLRAPYWPTDKTIGGV
jgi:acyl-CoA synthetase (AMP-forming)/AMP-acid ligase II